MIYRRGGVYHYDFSHRGRRYRASTETSDPKRAAKIETAAKAAAYRGRYDVLIGGARQPTLSEFMKETGVPTLKQGHADSTARNYAAVFAFVEMFAELRIGDVTGDHVARFIRARIEGSAPGLPHKASPATVRKDLSHLRGALQVGVDTDRLRKNPAAGARLPRVVAREYAIPTPEQVDNLLVELGKRPVLRDLVALVACTGLRRGEGCGLLNRSCLLDGKDPALVLAQAKVAGRTKRIPLVAEAVRILRAHVRREEPDAFVFMEHGRPVIPHVLWDAFVGARERAGLPRVRLHDLRHALGARLVAAGASLPEVGEILGHAPPFKTTLLYVQHAGSEAGKRRAIEAALARRPNATPTSQSQSGIKQ